MSVVFGVMNITVSFNGDLRNIFQQEDLFSIDDREAKGV